MLRQGSRPFSRRAAIRLSRLTPNRCFPSAAPPKSDLGTRRFSHTGQIRAIKTCSVTWTGTRGRSMISRVRCPQPPARPVPHSGQDSRACSTRWVGVAKAGKAVRPGLPGAFLPGAFLPGSLLAAGLGLDAGHPFGAAGLGLSLRVSMRRCNWSITACWRAMTANKASRGAVVRSRPVSMFQI